MKSSLVVAVLALCGCGHSGGDLFDGGGHMLDDGHVQSGCQVEADCDTSQKCVLAHCNSITHACEYPPKMCSAVDQCNASSCDMHTGDCVSMPTNEGGTCNTQQGAPGTCVTGICLAAPSCIDPSGFFTPMLSCDTSPGGIGGLDYNNNFPSPFGSPPTQKTSKYGSCATNETAPEYAYVFNNVGATDVDVTVHLYVQGVTGSDGGIPDDGGTPDDGGSDDDGGAPAIDMAGADLAVPSNGDVDLDLIILEGACLETSPCANPPLAGGGFQGITLGTGTETVTFHAKAATQYYIVVDGKNGASASYVIEIEACGVCQPTAQNTVGCGQSVPIAGNTAAGAAQLDNYTCTTGGSLSAPGKEQYYYFPPVDQQRDIRATVTGASQPVTLAVLADDYVAQCAPGGCLAGATATGTAPNMSASVLFTAQQSFGYNVPYWIVVDSPSGMDSSYGLSIECVPTCSQSGTTLDCTTKTANGSTAGQPAMVSAWGPPGMTCGDSSTQSLVGPEYLLLFVKPVGTGTPVYRFTLASQTNNTRLALLLMDAGANPPASCSPESPCAMATPMQVAATSTTLASTGTFIAEAAGVNASYPNGRTAVVDLTTGLTTAHYYWVVVDGLTAADAANFSLSIDQGCN